MIVNNQTPKPLRLQLGGGKVLHLAPRGSGNISPTAAERPAIQKMVERGDISIVSESETHHEGPTIARPTGDTPPARKQRKGLK